MALNGHSALERRRASEEDASCGGGGNKHKLRIPVPKQYVLKTEPKPGEHTKHIESTV